MIRLDLYLKQTREGGESAKNAMARSNMIKRQGVWLYGYDSPDV
jgi:hypothetical protein